MQVKVTLEQPKTVVVKLAVGPKGEKGDTVYVGNIDGGSASSVFGGTQPIDGGDASSF